MIIYLTRHTEYDNPNRLFVFHLPVNLSVNGRAHAQRMGQWFAKNATKSLPIISSPIARCIQTTEIISSHTDSFVTFDDRLIETRCANLQGTQEPENKTWQTQYDDQSRETQSAILERSLNLYKEIVEKGADRILVSHGDPLTILLYHLTNQTIPHYLWSPEQEPHNVQRGEIVKLTIENKEVKDIKRIKV